MEIQSLLLATHGITTWQHMYVYVHVHKLIKSRHETSEIAMPTLIPRLRIMKAIPMHIHTYFLFKTSKYQACDVGHLINGFTMSL